MNTSRIKMKSATWVAVAGLALMRASTALGQHEGHQMGGGSGGDGACVARATESLRIVEGATRRLEVARQTNSPQRMRAAMDELQAALADIRTQLSLCVNPSAPSSPGAAPGAQGMDHSSMEGMDHSQMHHEMGSTPSRTPTPEPKPRQESP